MLAVGNFAPPGMRRVNASVRILPRLAASELRGRKTLVTWIVCERSGPPPSPWTGLSTLLIRFSIVSSWPDNGRGHDQPVLGRVDDQAGLGRCRGRGVIGRGDARNRLPNHLRQLFRLCDLREVDAHVPCAAALFVLKLGNQLLGQRDPFTRAKQDQRPRGVIINCRDIVVRVRRAACPTAWSAH